MQNLSERISNIEKTRLETEKKLKAERDKNFDRLKEEGKFTFNQVNFSKELTKLAKKSNALAKSKKGIILENFGLEAKNTKFIDAVKKATNAKEKTAYKELEKLRLDSLEELGEGTFDLDIFKSKIADIDLSDKLKDSPTDKFSQFQMMSMQYNKLWIWIYLFNAIRFTTGWYRSIYFCFNKY